MNAKTTKQTKQPATDLVVVVETPVSTPMPVSIPTPVSGFLLGKSMSVSEGYVKGNTGAIFAQIPSESLAALPLGLSIPVNVTATDVITGARVESVGVGSEISLAALIHFGLLGLTERVYTNKLELKDSAVKGDKAKGIESKPATYHTLQDSTELKFQAWQNGYQTFSAFDAATRESPEVKAARIAAELLAAKCAEIDAIKSVATTLEGISEAQREWVSTTPSAELVDLIGRVIESPKWPGLKDRVLGLSLTHYAPIESDGRLF